MIREDAGMEIRIPLQQFAGQQTVMGETGDVLGKVCSDLLVLSDTLSRRGDRGNSNFPEEERIKYAGDIRRIADELEEERKAIAAMEEFLSRVSRIYGSAEERITDRYNLEDRVYPETVFGTSHFENLAHFRDLLPIDGK